jgi:hypothetical protein
MPLVKIQLTEEQRVILRGIRGKHTANIERDIEGWHLVLREVEEKPVQQRRKK